MEDILDRKKFKGMPCDRLTGPCVICGDRLMFSDSVIHHGATMHLNCYLKVKLKPSLIMEGKKDA